MIHLAPERCTDYLSAQQQDHNGSETMPAHRVKPNICLYHTTKIKQLTAVKWTEIRASALLWYLRQLNEVFLFVHENPSEKQVSRLWALALSGTTVKNDCLPPSFCTQWTHFFWCHLRTTSSAIRYHSQPYTFTHIRCMKCCLNRSQCMSIMWVSVYFAKFSKNVHQIYFPFQCYLRLNHSWRQMDEALFFWRVQMCGFFCILCLIFAAAQH